MKKLINEPTRVTREMLEGMVAMNPSLALLGDESVVIRSDIEQWRTRGGEWAEQRRRRRRRGMPPPGSTEREAELERLLGQKQVELDFLGEALRRIEQAQRPTVEPRAPSPGRLSLPGRLGRKAG